MPRKKSPFLSAPSITCSITPFLGHELQQMPIQITLKNSIMGPEMISNVIRPDPLHLGLGSLV